MAGGYSYKDVETALMAVFDAQQGTLRGRLKRLQTLGLPAGGPGKGQRTSYADAQITDWLIALEIQQFGIDPILSVQMVRDWKLSGFVKNARHPKHGDVHIVIRPRFISSARASGHGPEIEAVDLSGFFLAGRSGTASFQEFLAKKGTRACVFNLSARMRELDKALNSGRENGTSPA